MKAELQVLAAATASACDRVRLEAGDGDSVNFQRWGEQPVTIIATSPASSRGRFAINIAALMEGKGQEEHPTRPLVLFHTRFCV